MRDGRRERANSATAPLQTDQERDSAVSDWDAWVDQGRCYWHRDANGEEVLIPGCYGVLNGPDQCTCDHPMSRIEHAEDIIRQQHEHIERLRERLEEMRGELREACADCREFSHENNVLRRRLSMIESATK